MKTFTVSLFSLLSLSSFAFARPQPRAPCTNPVLRKEWSAATATERSSYINAALCLATKPSKIGLNTTLYDDFTWVHAQLNEHIHTTAQFLPWHRYYIDVYEKELKACGYSGSLLYWDWAAVWSAPDLSPVWSPTTGFGGNGTAHTDVLQRCITDGPFVNLRPAYYGGLGETLRYAPHCITRKFGIAIPLANYPALLGRDYAPAIMTAVNARTEYATFRKHLEDIPHGSVHAGIGGEMRPPLASPNDPIFFLHHTNVDRIWWLWQQANYTARAFDYSGPEFGGVNGTLNTVLQMLGLSGAADAIVGDYMETNTTRLCYKY